MSTKDDLIINQRMQKYIDRSSEYLSKRDAFVLIHFL